eukprot:2407585-Alexandrium_andersonii.AAC.1
MTGHPSVSRHRTFSQRSSFSALFVATTSSSGSGSFFVKLQWCPFFLLSSSSCREAWLRVV